MVGDVERVPLPPDAFSERVGGAERLLPRGGLGQFFAKRGGEGAGIAGGRVLAVDFGLGTSLEGGTQELVLRPAREMAANARFRRSAFETGAIGPRPVVVEPAIDAFGPIVAAGADDAVNDAGLYQIGQPVHQVDGGVGLDEGTVGNVVENAGAETGYRLRLRRFDDTADRLAQGPVSPPQGLIAGAPMRGVLGNRQIRFPAGNHDAPQWRDEASQFFIPAG